MNKTTAPRGSTEMATGSIHDFRQLLRQWDRTARQGMPQLAGGHAVFSWRGPDDDRPGLHRVSAAWLRQNLAPDHLPQPPPPGSGIDLPGDCFLRGFTLAPDGRRVAALLSSAGTELSEVWLLAPEAAPRKLDVPGSWHAAPVWEADAGHLWVLAGKPPAQSLWCGSLRPRGGLGPFRKVGLPDALGESLNGVRLRLGLSDGAVMLRAQQPGGRVRIWKRSLESWTRLPATSSKVSVLGPDVRVLARLEGPQAEILAVEGAWGTEIRYGGEPIRTLHAAEQLTAMSSNSQDGCAEVWLQTASPEQPSAVVRLPLPRQGRRLPPLPPRRGHGGFTHMRLMATARDGTRIPVLLSVDSSVERTAKRPRKLLLSCYGGFGVIHRTEPEPSVCAWLASGGCYAAAQIRGGGEMGPAWHDAGRGSNKLQAMLDFIDVARFLDAEGWTTAEQLTAVGASHGGLVVTAAGLLEPSAFGAIIATAPLLDTVDLHRHGLGTQWEHEFGGRQEAARAAYSPIHLIREMGVTDNLPDYLCCTLGQDQRVDNSLVPQFLDQWRQHGGRAWHYQERAGSHAQRAAGDVLDFSATVLSFAAGQRPEVQAASREL